MLFRLNRVAGKLGRARREIRFDWLLRGGGRRISPRIRPISKASEVIERILVDTGPIVSLLKRKDAHHETCKAHLKWLRGPLLTCWPFVTEAARLLRKDTAMVKRLLLSVDAGLFGITTLDTRAMVWMPEFIDRYKKLGAQVADAAIVYLAERDDIGAVFTLDRRDFSVDRTTAGKALRVLPET